LNEERQIEIWRRILMKDINRLVNQFRDALDIDKDVEKFDKVGEIYLYADIVIRRYCI